jgi:hypothetical protein
MCNDYGNDIPYGAYLEAFSETRIKVRFPRAAPNLQPRDDQALRRRARRHGFPRRMAGAGRGSA